MFTKRKKTTFNRHNFETSLNNCRRNIGHIQYFLTNQLGLQIQGFIRHNFKNMYVNFELYKKNKKNKDHFEQKLILQQLRNNFGQNIYFLTTLPTYHQIPDFRQAPHTVWNRYIAMLKAYIFYIYSISSDFYRYFQCISKTTRQETR